MKKPLIGISPLYDYNLSSWWIIPGYMEGIIKTGGLPVMLPFDKNPEDMAEYVSALDGFIITGGPDVDPSIYGEEPIMEIGLIASKRDVNERLIIKEALAQDKPILGICRGHQLMNALRGGTLYQDLPTQRPDVNSHSQELKNIYPWHDDEIVPGTPLYDWMKGESTIEVNSFHHQAVKELGEGLVPMAYSLDDRLVESYYDPEKKFYVGVQWHPELLSKSKDEKISGQQLSIFRALVEAAAK